MIDLWIRAGVLGWTVLVAIEFWKRSEDPEFIAWWRHEHLKAALLMAAVSWVLVFGSVVVFTGQISWSAGIGAILSSLAVSWWQRRGRA